MGAVISQTGEDLNVANWPTFFSHGSFYCKSIFPELHLTVTWPCFTTRKYENPPTIHFPSTQMSVVSGLHGVPSITLSFNLKERPVPEMRQ